MSSENLLIYKKMTYNAIYSVKNKQSARDYLKKKKKVKALVAFEMNYIEYVTSACSNIIKIT